MFSTSKRDGTAALSPPEGKFVDDATSHVLALAAHLLREEIADNEPDARLAALLIIAAVDQAAVRDGFVGRSGTGYGPQPDGSAYLACSDVA